MKIEFKDIIPDEIGLFLGYPPEDVEGFLNDPCKGVKICGCWKAYGNEAEARKAFEKIRKCNDVYKSDWYKSAGDVIIN